VRRLHPDFLVYNNWLLLFAPDSGRMAIRFVDLENAVAADRGILAGLSTPEVDNFLRRIAIIFHRLHRFQCLLRIHRPNVLVVVRVVMLRRFLVVVFQG